MSIEAVEAGAGGPGVGRPLPPSVAAKLVLLFDGIRYSDALGAAAAHSFPNFYPYRFRPGERNPTGAPTAPIPYLLALDDGTIVRVRGDGDSAWSVSGSAESGYRLARDGDPDAARTVRFEPLPQWMGRTTEDGFPMASAGVSLHGDMAVINVAPGCEYFNVREGGRSLRCVFCSYGAPDARSRRLGQERGRSGIPEATCRRLQETLAAALEESPLRHLYLVGGSMVDWHDEGERYIELARVVQEVNRHRVPLACGSGALPEESLRRLHGEGLVDSVCFNLEVWSEPLFARVCPGKHRFVGYRRWIEALERAVGLWGPGRVYSAIVAGIELDPEYGLSAAEAARLALEGADDLCARGILPIYSLYFPVGLYAARAGWDDLRSYFEELAAGYHEIRRRRGLEIWDGFMCHRCAYMQVECDLDRAPAAREGHPPGRWNTTTAGTARSSSGPPATTTDRPAEAEQRTAASAGSAIR